MRTLQVTPSHTLTARQIAKFTKSLVASLDEDIAVKHDEETGAISVTSRSFSQDLKDAHLQVLDAAFEAAGIDFEEDDFGYGTGRLPVAAPTAVSDITVTIYDEQVSAAPVSLTFHGINTPRAKVLAVDLEEYLDDEADRGTVEVMVAESAFANPVDSRPSASSVRSLVKAVLNA